MGHHPHLHMIETTMTSLMILDEAKTELIAGGRRFRMPTFEVELSVDVNQKADAKNYILGRAYARGAGASTIAGEQSVLAVNNIGFADFSA